jgi:hypothetical protein
MTLDDGTIVQNYIPFGISMKVWLLMKLPFNIFEYEILSLKNISRINLAIDLSKGA